MEMIYTRPPRAHIYYTSHQSGKGLPDLTVTLHSILEYVLERKRWMEKGNN
jgi:hypothetical protein